jgi:uncharacterized protein (DUF1015 family)
MARFEAFRGTTYDVGSIRADDVIAPPYDVVRPLERAQLAARSPYNAITVELPLADAAGGLDAYANAAAIFGRWHRDAVVRVEDVAAYYLYRMSFTDEDGSTRSTTGVLGTLGLDPENRGDVLPHEQTTPNDKSDRLSLLRAARTNFSPIWGLAVGAGLAKTCEEAIALSHAEPWTATDSDSVVHERWTVTAPALLDAISSVIAAAPVLIADGHHRYATARAYSAEHPEETGADGVLAFVVELVESELAVQAIHRLVNGVDAAALPTLLSRHFDVQLATTDVVALRQLMAVEGALGLITCDGAWLMRPRQELREATEDDLDSSLLARALADLEIDQVRYQHGLAIATEAVESGDADAAVLLRPVSIAQIARTAHGGRLMPPKSTFFLPKPRTGMVFRELDPA